MNEGFATEEALVDDTTAFVFSPTPSIADLCLVTQAYNAQRRGVDQSSFLKVTRIEERCLAIPEIAAAHPDNQPDAKITT